MFCVVFFFKQKTAYELRISDWSSDVCSSDLRDLHKRARQARLVNRNLRYAARRDDRGQRASGARDHSGKKGKHIRRQGLHIVKHKHRSHAVCQGQCGKQRLARWRRSEEHTSELPSLMRISYAVLCLKKKMKHK